MSKEKIIEIDDSIIRDFRRAKQRWGWNIISWTTVNKTEANVIGMGRLPSLGDGDEIDAGDIMLVTLADDSGGDIEAAFEVSTIEYDKIQKDLFRANVKAVGTLED